MKVLRKTLYFEEIWVSGVQIPPGPFMKDYQVYDVNLLENLLERIGALVAAESGKEAFSILGEKRKNHWDAKKRDSGEYHLAGKKEISKTDMFAKTKGVKKIYQE
jgi:hypothetical protein